DPVAGPGEALVEIAFSGVNFMDIGVRQGMAWTEVPDPKILGVEGVGRVLAVGDGVDDVEPGRRVAWVYAPGSYAQRIAIPAASLVPVPDTIDRGRRPCDCRYRGSVRRGGAASDPWR